jgi:hypothetical protein
LVSIGLPGATFSSRVGSQTNGALFPLRWSSPEAGIPILEAAKTCDCSILDNPADLTFCDLRVFLDTAGVARKIAEFRRSESIYTKGKAADSVR